MTDDQVRIRPLAEHELEEADRIMRVAFGTYTGLADPADFMGDGCCSRSRWKASPASSFAAEVDGRLAGSSFATRWGSIGFLRPLSLDPIFWNRSFPSALTEPGVEMLDVLGVTHAGLFTFAQSPKHIGLYQKFGFRPRSLTLVLERAVPMTTPRTEGWSSYPPSDEPHRSEILAACQDLTDGICPGLDVTPEVRSIREQSLGETVLVGGPSLMAFAACHVGPGSEADSGACYIKFGAAAPCPGGRDRFRRLLGACESFAGGAGATRIVAGINAARTDAYEEMLSAGFRIYLTGISMHRPNEPGFSRPDVFAIDDWR
jgi:hypothetical protein